MIYIFSIQAASVTVSMVRACIEHHHVQPWIPQNHQKGFSCMLVVRVLFQFVFPFGVWVILHFFGIHIFFGRSVEITFLYRNHIFSWMPQCNHFHCIVCVCLWLLLFLLFLLMLSVMRFIHLNAFFNHFAFGFILI